MTCFRRANRLFTVTWQILKWCGDKPFHDTAMNLKFAKLAVTFIYIPQVLTGV